MTVAPSWCAQAGGAAMLPSPAGGPANGRHPGHREDAVPGTIDSSAIPSGIGGAMQLPVRRQVQGLDGAVAGVEP